MKDNHIDIDSKEQCANSEALIEALQKMKDEDIRNVDPESLTELTQIRIDNSLPVADRITSLLHQTQNPYCYRYNGMIVKTSFAGKQSIEDCLAACFFRT